MVNPPIQVILVPQGAEYGAVCRGMGRVQNPPLILPTPAGTAIAAHLHTLHQSGFLESGQTVLLMGLCGGLVPSLAVGDVVLYQASHSPLPNTPPQVCDRDLSRQLQTKLADAATWVTAVTSDRVISTPAEKQQLAQQRGAEVVDMEGFAALDVLHQIGASVATLRVVSDDCHGSIPNLSHAFRADGSLNAGAMAIALIREPIAAITLIRGSLQGLKVLQKLTATLFN